MKLDIPQRAGVVWSNAGWRHRFRVVLPKRSRALLPETGTQEQVRIELPN